MIDVVFCFEAHQPRRLKQLRPGDRLAPLDYFDVALDRLVLERVVARCYLPMNRLLLELIERSDGRFRCALSLSGTLIEQLRQWAPAALDSFVALAASGNVEFLCETSQHSLAAVEQCDEFEDQVEIQRSTVGELFGAPTSFRNTELILDNGICRRVERLGFACMLGEGVDRVLGWHSPHVPYRPLGCRRLQLLLRSYALSDDISFRFSDRGWSCWPLCADTYAGWLHGLPSPAQYVGLFMDYETFGEHQDASTGIFEFVRHLPEHVLADPRFRFRTPAQVAAERPAVDELDFREPVSWADPDRGLSPWIGNPMQLAAHRALYALRPRVAALAASRPDLLAAWRRLCTSDHVHYVATGGQRDDGGHDRSRPFGSPHGAFVTLMTVLDDLRLQVERAAATIGRPDR